MQKRIISPLFFVAFLLISHSAWCWGVIGHRTIAEIGQQHLSKKAKKEITKLIGRQSLSQWANWADFIKSDSSWNHASKWHYVDLPGHMPKDSFVAALKALPGKNLYTQIQATMQDLGNRSLPDEQRRVALYFLVHLVGDLHQPLHVGRDEDQGGNKITVNWFDKKTNLHSLWDSQLIEFQQYSYSEYARMLDIAPDKLVKAWQAGSLEDWFFESHEVADMIYDATPADAKLSYRYNFQFQQVLDRQLLKGGLRLAEVINRAFE